MAEEHITEIELEGSVDMHFHFRDAEEDGDGRMEMLAQHVADEHEVLVCIGNTKKPILTQEDATRYVQKAQSHLPRDKDTILMVAPLLTDRTTPDMVREMRLHQPRTVGFIKAFMAGVSNDFGNSVSDVRALLPTLRALHDDSVDAPPLTCHWHMERKYDISGQTIPMFEREWYAVEHDMQMVLECDEGGQHVIKHATDERTLTQVDAWRRLNGYDIYVELASQYFVRTFEDLFEGAGRKGTAFNAHDLCWPLYKHENSRKAVNALGTSPYPEDTFAMFGSDCAWWFDDPTRDSGVKITCDGVVCGGVSILPAVSKSIIIEAFVRRGTPDLLDEFFSRRARRLLGLPPARTKVRYRREDWQVPGLLTHENNMTGEKFRVRPFMRGETCLWRRVL